MDPGGDPGEEVKESLEEDRLVLVTGATGLLGTHLVRRLNRAGIIPRVLLRRDIPEEAWGDLKVVPVRGDLAGKSGNDSSSLDNALRGIDTVFHLAAFVHMSWKNRDRHEAVNFGGAVSLYQAAARTGVRRFVQVSTIATVGGASDGTPLDEGAAWNLAHLNNPYIDTKRSAEEYLLSEPEAERNAAAPHRPRGPDVIVVNPSIILSEWKSVRSRSSSLEAGRKAPTRAVPSLPPWIWLLRFFLFRPPLSLNVVDADDVAHGITLAAQKGTPGRRYLLTGHNLDWPDVVRAVRPWVRVGPPVIPVTHRLLTGSARLLAFLSRMTGARTKWTVNRAGLAAIRWHYSPSRAERELGWCRTPLDRTLQKVLGKKRRGSSPESGAPSA